MTSPIVRARGIRDRVLQLIRVWQRDSWAWDSTCFRSSFGWRWV